MKGFRQKSLSVSSQSDGRQEHTQDYEKLFRQLWTVVQPFVHATETLFDDQEFGDSNNEKMFPGKKSPGYGKEFAVFRARRQLTFQNFEEFKDVADEIREKKIAHNNTIDKRGMR